MRSLVNKKSLKFFGLYKKYLLTGIGCSFFVLLSFIFIIFVIHSSNSSYVLLNFSLFVFSGLISVHCYIECNNIYYECRKLSLYNIYLLMAYEYLLLNKKKIPKKHYDFLMGLLQRLKKNSFTSRTELDELLNEYALSKDKEKIFLKIQAECFRLFC